MGTKALTFKPTGILNAKVRDKYFRACLAKACQSLRDRARDYVSQHHTRHGNLLHSIRYRTIAKNDSYTGKVYISEDELETKDSSRSYAFFIIHGTEDYHVPTRRFPNGRKTALKWFDDRYDNSKGGYTFIGQGGVRTGIRADDFMSKIANANSSDVTEVFRKGMKMLNVEF